MVASGLQQTSVLRRYTHLLFRVFSYADILLLMEISQLRTLIQVAELGSLSKASDRMHIAQPALSRQVRMLEDELGVRLFERHGRGMVISEAGQDVLRHAYRVMAELQEIKSTVADSDASLKGHVSIGMPPTVSDILAVPLVSAFRARHPEATIRIVSAYSGYVLDWLHKGEIDAAVLFESRSARSVKSEPLLEESLFLIGPPDRDLHPDQPVEFSSLEGENLLLPSHGHSLRGLLADCAKGRGISLRVMVEADSFSTLKALVHSGNGMTILPLGPIHEDVKEGRLSYAPLINPVPKRRLMISIPSDRPSTRLSRFACEMLRASAVRLVNEEVWPGTLLR